MKFYTGIGSRTSPPEALQQMQVIASLLELLGFTLRSGGAIGADQAFERGVTTASNKVILRPKHSTTEAEKVASEIHPAWHLCNEYARKLHGRNVQLVLGEDLKTHSSLVVAWTLSPERGGTRTGLVVAQSHNIPVFNLADPAQNMFFMTKLRKATFK